MRLRSLLLTAVTAAGMAFSPLASAANVGWRTMVVGQATDPAPIPVALWYPTEAPAPAKPVPMGPFEVRAAIGAPMAPQLRGLILLSHGTGGTELGHGRLAEALARHGYLVAALRHPGDNWQDRSLLTGAPQRYFDERPRQVSRVLDALTADADLRARIASDEGGLRIGALGHSAGGYTVLALAGGVPSPSRVAAHCGRHQAEDPIFCGMRSGSAAPAAASAPDEQSPPLADKRIRAVAALAPLGVVFDAASLGRIGIPVAVWEAGHDRFLVPQFHAEWVARNLPAPELHRVPDAWHFAFMDTPHQPIPSPDGDVAADPAGFDRAQFLERLGEELATYFDAAMAATAHPAGR